MQQNDESLKAVELLETAEEVQPQKKARKGLRTKPKIEVNLQEVERLAGLGLSQEKIAFHLNMSAATLYNRKKDVKEFREAIARGRTRAEIKAADYLQRLIDQNDRQAIMFYLKTQCGWSETVKSDVKAEVQSDVKATLNGRLEITKLTDAELASMINDLSNRQSD